jgi:glutamate carboxypeptidase
MPRHWLSTFESDLPRLCADLKDLVLLESPTADAALVSRLGEWVHDRLRERGVPAELRHCAPAGDAVLASVAYRDGGTLLLGHLDTVWPAGTLAAMPWTLQGERASGPGVFDMKAGIAVGMAVLTAMVRETDPSPVSLLLVPDEETGSTHSRELLLSVARRHRQVLVLEPSKDGAAKVERKGAGVFVVRFAGRAAHAGLEPERGASALAEMARFTLCLEGLADSRKETTLTPSQARAGTAANVVPESAELTVDARAWTREEAARVSAAVRAYHPTDPAVTVSVEGGFDRPPLERTPANEALYQRARSAAGDFGFELGGARVGGASDGNITSGEGIATLDGLGPTGGGAHARDEHVVVADLPRRAALLARLCSPES